MTEETRALLDMRRQFANDPFVVAVCAALLELDDSINEIRAAVAATAPKPSLPHVWSVMGRCLYCGTQANNNHDERCPARKAGEGVGPFPGESPMTVICDHAEGCTRDADSPLKCPHLVPNGRSHPYLAHVLGCPWEPDLTVRCVPAKEGK